MTTINPPPCPNPACRSDDTEPCHLPAGKSGSAGCDTEFWMCNECRWRFGGDYGDRGERDPEYGD